MSVTDVYFAPQLDNTRSVQEVFVRVEQHELRDVSPGTAYPEKVTTLGVSEHSISENRMEPNWVEDSERQLA